jgi:hypothetical protein
MERINRPHVNRAGGGNHSEFIPHCKYPFFHLAAENDAFSSSWKNGDHFCLSGDLLGFLDSDQAGGNLLQVIRQVVDNTIKANLDLMLLCEFLDPGQDVHIEPENQPASRFRHQKVGLGNLTDSCLDDLDIHFRGGKRLDCRYNGLTGAHGIGLHNDLQPFPCPVKRYLKSGQSWGFPVRHSR